MKGFWQEGIISLAWQEDVLVIHLILLFPFILWMVIGFIIAERGKGPLLRALTISSKCFDTLFLVYQAYLPN